jgi:hypothetical protein
MMQVTILEHNIHTAVAKIRFEQDDIVHEDTYNLLLVVPGTMATLRDQNLEFTLEMQERVIDQLTSWMQVKFDEGTIQPHLDGNKE